MSCSLVGIYETYLIWSKNSNLFLPSSNDSFQSVFDDTFLFLEIVPLPKWAQLQRQRVGTAGQGMPSDSLGSLLSRGHLTLVPHIERHSRGDKQCCAFSSSPKPIQWGCLLPGAVVLFLFFFLLFFFFTISGASGSSLSSFKTSPLRSWGSPSRCSSAMISDSEMKWRISCWEPPVVKAPKCAGGIWANNELLESNNLTRGRPPPTVPRSNTFMYHQKGNDMSSQTHSSDNNNNNNKMVPWRLHDMLMR